MSSMLPPPPKTFGMLGDVLISALGSVLGQTNPLSLPKRRSICVLLVDGLGAQNLKQSSAYARFLSSQPVRSASCFYPATTSTSLVSFSTGKAPWETNFIGYQIFDRDKGKPMNLLSGWSSATEGKHFQTLRTISERAIRSEVPFHVVSPSAYKDSGFTAATMRCSTFHGLNSLEERFELARKLLADQDSKVIYLYVPELDQTAHAKGWQSIEWTNLLEDLDAQVAKITATLPKQSGLIITSDHGVIDIPPESHVYIDELVRGEELDFVGGDTRGLFLYLKDQSNVKGIRETLTQGVGESCYVINPNDLFDAGYWKPVMNTSLLPDLIVLARKEVALYHRDFAKKKSLDMIGHHGSISSTEMSIPLICLGF